MFNIKSSAILVVMRMAGILISMLNVVILARVLQPESYGIYVYAMAIVTVLSVPSKVGIPGLVAREITINILEKRIDLARGIVSRSTQVVVIVSVIVCTSALFFFANIRTSQTDEFFKTFILGLLLVPIIALGSLRSAVLRGLKYINLSQLPEYIIRPGLLLVIVCIFFLLNKPLDSSLTMTLHVVSGIVAFYAGNIMLKRRAPMLLTKDERTYSDKIWFRQVIPFALIGSAEIVIQQFPIMIVGHLFDPSQIAQYRVAFQFSIVVLLGVSLIQMAAEPHIAEKFKQEKYVELQLLITRATRISFAVTLMSFGVFYLAGRHLIILLFGNSYVNAYGASLVMLIGAVIAAYFAMIDSVLRMTGNEKLSSKATQLAAAICIFISLLLVPKFGILGGAISSSITLAARALFLHIVARKILLLKFGVL